MDEQKGQGAEPIDEKKHDHGNPPVKLVEVELNEPPPKRIPAGNYTGKTLKIALGVPVDHQLDQVIRGKFDEQARTIFALLNRTLERAGGSLANMVTMTVFIDDARNGERFVQIRREHFPDGRYPCSALLTISGFARPGITIEIQGVAVV